MRILLVFTFLASGIAAFSQSQFTTSQDPQIYFVYNAKGSLAGELNYLYGKYFQDEHCALCDITHGTFSAKPEWKAWEATLTCTHEVLHIDEAEALGLDLSSFTLPVVLLQHGSGLEELVSASDMTEAGKEVADFIRLFETKAEQFGVSCN